MGFIRGLESLPSDADATVKDMRAPIVLGGLRIDILAER